MKVQIYAQSLAVACERYADNHNKLVTSSRAALISELLKPQKQEPNREIVFTGWWLWRKAVVVETPQPDWQRTPAEAEYEADCMGYNQPIPDKILNLWAIAKHRRADHMFETTDDELGQLCKFLTPVQDETGRI